MTKVYVVTAGSYSDYHICGIYSTPEKAETEKVKFEDVNDVEEWELDKPTALPDGYFQWWVLMRENGDTERVTQQFLHGVESDVHEDWYPQAIYPPAVRFLVIARDEQHAVKIANERRAALIASGEWTTDWREWRKRRTLPQPKPEQD